MCNEKPTYVCQHWWEKCEDELCGCNWYFCVWCMSASEENPEETSKGKADVE